MQIPERYRATTTAKRAMVNVAIALAATALLAALGLVAAVNNPDGAPLLGGGAVFMGIGVFIVIAIGSYSRLSRALFSLLGILMIIVGFGFFAGGLARIMLPHVNYLCVWGITLMLLAAITALGGLYVRLLATSAAKKKQTLARVAQVEKNLRTRADALATSFGMCGCALLLFIVGLLMALRP